MTDEVADVLEDRPPDPAIYLHQLRKDFPRVGILADPPAGRWMAVLPNRDLVRAHNGLELREKLTELATTPRPPSQTAI